jgi:glycosyltransferase involved in cell wall biosynthesis
MIINHSDEEPALSLVLVCYNEEHVLLERSVKEIFQVLNSIQWTSEIIFVDDASCDQASVVIDGILRENPNRSLRKIEHTKLRAHWPI